MVKAYGIMKDGKIERIDFSFAMLYDKFRTLYAPHEASIVEVEITPIRHISREEADKMIEDLYGY